MNHNFQWVSTKSVLGFHLVALKDYFLYFHFDHIQFLLNRILYQTIEKLTSHRFRSLIERLIEIIFRFSKHSAMDNFQDIF